LRGGRGAAGAEFEGARIEAPKGMWRGCAPSAEKYFILALNMMSFGAFWVVFFTVQLLFVNWQLHISLTRTAQIYSELHFCVEMHTEKAPVWRMRENIIRTVLCCTVYI